jgi:hypothetical protein
MAISSRTPEGAPHRCPICGEVANLEPSYPGGDSVCPACANILRLMVEHFEFMKLFNGRGRPSSLDMLDAVFRIERELRISVPRETVLNLIEYLQRWQPRGLD